MLKKCIVSTIAFFLANTIVLAGGWNNTLIGCRAVAMGGAFTGLADDPSAIFYNPAGLIYQREKFNFSIDGFYIWPTHEYTLSTGSKAESKYNNPVPQIFISYRASPKITLGFGVFVPYAGGGVDWKKEDLGYPFKSTMGIVSFTPSVAYQINEKLSLGFNLNFYSGTLSVHTEMDPFGPLNQEENGSSVSAGFGLMFRPSDRIGIGLSVRGPAKIRLSGKTSFKYDVLKINLDSETSFRLPWDFEIGVSYRVSERLLFSSSAQYTLWSVLDKVSKTIKEIPYQGDLNVDEDMDFKDILIFRAGMEYLLPKNIFLRVGIGLDRYATPDSTLNFKNIDVDKFTLLGGIGYKAGRMQIDAVYAYGIGKEREKRSESLGFLQTEKYNLNVLIFGLGVTFSF
ncbi:MAG: outer membrane protein transport protein [Candidatus Aminicenantales bacterium]